jgi:hypothetical protein
MILYDSALKSEGVVQSDNISSLRTRVNSLSAELVSFSHRLFGDAQSVNLDELSPFVPHALYQAAVIQGQLWMKTSDIHYMEALGSLRSVLHTHSKRWTVAGM